MKQSKNLEGILRGHRLWLKGVAGGKRANYEVIS